MNRRIIPRLAIPSQPLCRRPAGFKARVHESINADDARLHREMRNFSLTKDEYGD
jgi:hypothetical protein